MSPLSRPVHGCTRFLEFYRESVVPRVGRAVVQSADRADFTASRSGSRSVGRSVGRSLGRSVGRWSGRSVVRLVGRSLGRSAGRSVVRLGLVGRSLGRPLVWSIGRWVGRSVGRPVGRSTAHDKRTSPTQDRSVAGSDLDVVRKIMFPDWVWGQCGKIISERFWNGAVTCLNTTAATTSCRCLVPVLLTYRPTGRRPERLTTRPTDGPLDQPPDRLAHQSNGHPAAAMYGTGREN